MVHHDAPLIGMIVVGFGLAFILGALANRLRMPPLVGYLVAGILAGPFTPGFVGDTGLASQLSEIGVILLMFGVGLHFSLKDLLSVQAVAVPGALLVMAGGTAMGTTMGLIVGWPIGGGIVFGLALSVASTVVLLKALQDRHLVESERGRIAVGWVIVEDMAMVLALVLIPTFAGVMGGTAQAVHDPFVDLIERVTGLHLNIWAVLGVIGIKLLAFLGFMLVVGRRVIPWVLHMTAHTGSRELFRLAVLAIALGVAAGSAYVFGVSLALGAFFAGMILSESELSNRAAQESLPFRDAFAVLFFVSVGMLFDPSILITHPLEILGTLFIILIGKTAIGFFLVLALRRTAGAALTIAASLAQIGEFSFILAGLGISLQLFPIEAQNYILAGSIISIMLNPLLMFAADALRPGLEARFGGTPTIVLPQRVEPGLTATAAATPPPAVAETDDEQHPTRLAGHVVLIGYGRVGTVIADGLLRAGTPFVLVEDAEARLMAARAAGIETIAGNAASGRALGLANVAGARTMMVGIPNAFEAGQVVEQARRVNPGLKIVARAHSDEEDVYLRDLGANEVVMGEREIGLGMLGWAQGESGPASSASPFDAVAAALATAPTGPVDAEVRIEPDVPVVAGMAEAPESVVPELPPEQSQPEQGEALPLAAELPLESESMVADLVSEESTDALVEGEAEEPRSEPPDGVLAAAGEMTSPYPASGAIVPVDVGYEIVAANDAAALGPDDLVATAGPPPEVMQGMERALGTATLVEADAREIASLPAPEPVMAETPRPHGPSTTPGQPFVPRGREEV